MANKSQIIIVAGDPAVDIFQEELRHGEDAGVTVENWRRSPGYIWHTHVGGVLLLTEMLAAALKNVADVKGPTTVQDHPLQSGLVQSLALVEQAALKERQSPPSWYVTRFLGFSRPSRPTLDADYQALYSNNPDVISDAQILVIDDAGNGFRSQPGRWPTWFAADRPISVDTLVVKVNTPLPLTSNWQGDHLWERLSKIDARNRFIILNGHDLRRDNVDISRRLSWERTLRDLCATAAADQTVLNKLRDFGDVIVRFGTEGTALLEKKAAGSTETRLLCEPAAIEDDRQEGHSRYMPGATSAFTAGFVSALQDQPDLSSATSILRAIHSGMVTSIRLLQYGFIIEQADANDEFSRQVPQGKFTIPYDRIFERIMDHTEPGILYADQYVRSVFVQDAASPSDLHPLVPNWSNSKDNINSEKERPENIVRFGLRFVAPLPHARFGDLLTADYGEIEGYRSISNLFQKYLRNPNQEKPLSIAVFGSPGSGKSFGIKEIAKLLSAQGEGLKVEITEFNVAQWQDPQDLIGALHIARDIRLSGRLPLIFFDEFDSSLGSAYLGWLRILLAPMQDGKFKDGDRLHSVGKAIFVFAGGTANTFQDFNRNEIDHTQTSDFKKAKGPDFVSRLSGFVDIKDISNADGTEPSIAMQIRRAIVLRTKLEQWHPRLFNRLGQASIDPSVLKALLNVRKYNHGVRSLEAVLRMSDLTHQATHYSRSALPADDQLALHVDRDNFRKLLTET